MSETTNRLMTDVARRLSLDLPTSADRVKAFNVVRAKIAEDVEKNKFVYVGPGAEAKYGAPNGRFRLAYVSLREEDGYTAHLLKLPHPDPDIDTTVVVKILTKSDVSYQEVWAHRDEFARMWLDAQFPEKS